MGKGDKKSGKGKRFMGSFGKTRPRKKSNSAPPAEANTKAPAKKAKKQ